MKKTEVLEILDYMFEFLFSSSEVGTTTEIDDVTIKKYLTDAGFEKTNIEQALAYLTDMTGHEINVEEITKQTSNSIRIYSPTERRKLGVKGCGLLTYLESIKQLSPMLRELVIEQVISLPYECSFEELLWIIESAKLNISSKDLSNIINNTDYDIDKFSIRH